VSIEEIVAELDVYIARLTQVREPLAGKAGLKRGTARPQATRKEVIHRVGQFMVRCDQIAPLFFLVLLLYAQSISFK